MQQLWVLPYSLKSRWLERLRLVLAGSLVIWAAGLFYLALADWWLTHLWQWPLLLYLLYLVYFIAPPFWPDSELILNEAGQFAHGCAYSHIHLGLVTPFMIAVKVSVREQSVYKQGKSEWRWLIRDQFDRQGWARICRICKQVHQPQA